MQVPERVINKSLALFEGAILEKKSGIEESTPVWEVKIRNSSGSIVKFYWKQDDEALYRMDGQEGPFDYDILLGEGMINFNSARFAAVAAAKSDQIRTWRLRAEEDFADLWVYTFVIEGVEGTIEVVIDADNGEVLEID